MTHIRVVLLSGWSGAGKDTTADMLEDILDVSKLSFATELKKRVAAEFQFPYTWTMTQEGKQREIHNGLTVRDLLIQRGQAIRKEQNDPGFFARCVAQEIQGLSAVQTRFVIADWRLHCELEALKNTLAHLNPQFITVRVRHAAQTESPVKDSLTEHELDNFPFDVVITNKGTLMELYQEISVHLLPKLS